MQALEASCDLKRVSEKEARGQGGTDQLPFEILQNKQFQQTMEMSKSRMTLSQVISLEESPLSAEMQARLQSKLTAEMQTLLEKQEKEMEKKAKMQKLEMQFEEIRAKKLHKLEEKISKSDTVRQHSEKARLEKNKLRSEHYSEVNHKITQEHKEQTERSIALRKELEMKDVIRAKEGDSPLTPVSPRRNLSVRVANPQSASLKDIASKLQKAETNHQFYHNSIVQRLKERQKESEQVLFKHRTQSALAESDIYSCYYQHIESIQSRQGKKLKEQQKRIQSSKKTFGEKVQRLKNNLRQMESLRDQKEEDLREKLQRIAPKKTWKDERNEKYLEKFAKNVKLIEEKKEEKASHILERHLEMSVANRVYKEKKDKMIQAAKKQQILLHI